MVSSGWLGPEFPCLLPRNPYLAGGDAARYPITSNRLEESYAYAVYKHVYPNQTKHHSPDYGAVDEYSAAGRPSLAHP